MELMRFPSRGGFSVRSILTFAIVVIVAALLSVISSTPTFAVSDARWGGDSIIYNDHGFSVTTDITDPTGTIPPDATLYKTPLQISGSGSSLSRKVFIIYFTAGVDPPTATSASYVEFDYDAGTLSNPQNQKTISLDLQSNQSMTSSCSVEGIGWIICPVSNFMAKAMDTIFGWLVGMIEAQPLMIGDSGNSLYAAWNVMRSIANIAFVIAFLIIIYSQLTNVGVSNYGLKRLIPRLIVAAILVNLSYYVAALAIDASNVIGYSVQDIFESIRKSTFHVTDDNLSGINNNNTGNWAAVTGIVLGAGGLYGGAYYMAAGGLYLLLPVLLGVLTTVILVFVILAARQAIIVILVILAPLAFVANLLPNTEKLFDKWKDLFMTMLVFFPAFSLVFGGSQLAGQIIIQNAGDDVVMLIFGLAVQVAPLVITPLLLKLSGGLLGRIAQIANNPKKGLIDRNRNWAQSRAEHTKQRNIARGPRINPTTWAAGAVRRGDFRKRRLSDSTDIWKQAATNRYEETPEYSKINERRAKVDINKERIHSDHAAHVEHLKTRTGSSLHDDAMRAQVSKERLESQQQHLAGYYNTLRTVGGTDLNTSSLNLETAKTSAQAGEQHAAAYLNEQRTFRATQLGAAAERLEAAKLTAEGMQGRYTAHIDNLKIANDHGVTPNVGLANAAVFAQSSKEHAESAQNRVQAMFDRERASVGSTLNSSTLDLEATKTTLEKAKSQLATYITDQRTATDGALRIQTLEAEQAKQVQQKSEARLTKMVEEFKSGKIDRTTLSAHEQSIMDEMRADSITLSAEKQAATSAQYEIQRNIADVMTGTGPLTEQMLDIAQGVGGQTARLRAQSQAVKAARSLDNDALSANVELLKDAAQRSGTNIKRYSQELLEQVEKGLNMFDGEFITPDKIKAALQAQAEEKNIPMFERIRGNSNFDQSMVGEIIALNNGAFKAAGAFGLQDDPTINIDNYGSVDEYMHAMRVQRMSNLANANAAGLASWKFGMFVNLAKPEELRDTIQAALHESKHGKTPLARQLAEESLHGAYKTVRDALLNDDIRATMNDRESFVRTIEAELAKIHGQEPVPSEPLEIKVNPEVYEAENAAKKKAEKEKREQSESE